MKVVAVMVGLFLIMVFNLTGLRMFEDEKETRGYNRDANAMNIAVSCRKIFHEIAWCKLHISYVYISLICVFVLMHQLFRNLSFVSAHIV